jgi:regulator of replication initiation timing
VAKAVATRSLDLETIDRLEEKLKLLVGVVERLRTESVRLADENGRLTRELDSTRSRLSEAEGTSAELTALRD